MTTHRGLKCLTCGSEIFSEHRHDFKGCKCPKGSGTWVHVDGGRDYMKVGFEDGAIYEVIEREDHVLGTDDRVGGIHADGDV